MGSFFFFVCSKQKGFVKKGTEFLFLSIFWVVLDQKFFFSWTIRSSAFPLKISRKMDDRDIVILSIYFSRRMIWKKKIVFLYPQNKCDHLSLSCFGSKVKKKKSNLKKTVFSPNILYFKNYLQIQVPFFFSAPKEKWLKTLLFANSFF